MVNVTHDRHHGRARHRLSVVNAFLKQVVLDRVLFEHYRRVAEFFDDDGGRILIDDLVDGHHRSNIHHGLDEIG